LNPDQKDLRVRARKISGINNLGFNGLAKILEAKDLLSKYSIQRA
jgi:hypothetical protein